MRLPGASAPEVGALQCCLSAPLVHTRPSFPSARQDSLVCSGCLHPCQAEIFRAPLIEEPPVITYAHPRLSYRAFVFLQPHSPWGLHGAESSGGFPAFSPYTYGYGSQPTAAAPLLGFLFELPGCSLLPIFSPRKSFPWLSGLFHWLLPALGACPLSATSPTSSLRGSPSATDGQLHGRGTRAELPSVQGPAVVLSKC